MLLRYRLPILVASTFAAAAIAWAADAPSAKPADATTPSMNVPAVTLPATEAPAKATAKSAKSSTKSSAKAKTAEPAAEGSATTAPTQSAEAPRAPEAMPAMMPTLGAKAAADAPAAGASAPLVALTSAAAASAPADAASAPTGPLDTRIQDTKADVIQLNRDLLVLEEELLFPANTQVALFVSMDVGKMFDLDSVQVKLDDKLVANYLYTPLEVQALHRGGVQRVFLGNLKTGPHELVAFFTGKGPHERDYKRGATLKFEKGTEAKYIELRIRDSSGRLQPEFDVKTWQ
jgi:hypothetical protein